MSFCFLATPFAFPAAAPAWAAPWVWAAQIWPGARPASRSSAEAASEETLIQGAQRGERSAFEELYRRHVDLVWHRLTRLIGPDPDREDLTQQIFFEVFQRLGRFRGDSSFKTYLYRVVCNRAFDHLKRRVRTPRALPVEQWDLMVAPGDSPELAAENRQYVALTWECLDQIKPKKRIAFVLRMVEGLSLEEVAACSQAAVHLGGSRLIGSSSAPDPKQREFCEGQRRPGMVYDGYHSDTREIRAPGWLQARYCRKSLLGTLSDVRDGPYGPWGRPESQLAS